MDHLNSPTVKRIRATSVDSGINKEVPDIHVDVISIQNPNESRNTMSYIQQRQNQSIAYRSPFCWDQPQQNEQGHPDGYPDDGNESKLGDIDEYELRLTLDNSDARLSMTGALNGYSETQEFRYKQMIYSFALNLQLVEAFEYMQNGSEVICEEKSGSERAKIRISSDFSSLILESIKTNTFQDQSQRISLKERLFRFLFARSAASKHGVEFFDQKIIPIDQICAIVCGEPECAKPTKNLVHQQHENHHSFLSKVLAMLHISSTNKKGTAHQRKRSNSLSSMLESSSRRNKLDLGFPTVNNMQSSFSFVLSTEFDHSGTPLKLVASCKQERKIWEEGLTALIQSKRNGIHLRCKYVACEILPKANGGNDYRLSDA